MAIDIQTPIPVVDGSSISREEFYKQYYKPQKPVVLRGLWKQYPAYTKWTMDFFKQSMGNIEVGLFGNRKEDLSKTLQIPNATMRFDEYLDLIEREPTDLRRCTLLRSYRPTDWPAWSQAAGCATLHARGPQFDSSVLMVQAAIAGAGVALAPAAMFQRELSSGQLVRPFGVEVDQGRYWLTRSLAREPSPGWAMVRDTLLDAVA